MPHFTPEEIEILKKYVTNPEGDIFAVMNMPGMTGAAYARYSRAKGGFREVLLKEFIKNFPEGAQIDLKHAEELIARVLVAFGDDSVGELEGVHMSFENISNLATKIIEDRRIGGSPIEQSSRYVVYDQKDENGKFRYLREKKIIASKHAPDYEKTLDEIFQTYVDLMPKMQAYFQKQKPLEEAEYDIRGEGGKIRYKDCANDQEKKAFEKTYAFDLRAKTCDTLRGLLPVATLTNAGMFGNGRFYQNLLTHLYSSDVTEMQEIGQKAQIELNKLIPQYVKRAKQDEYIVLNRKNMHILANELLQNEKPENEEQIVLLGNALGEDEFRDFYIAQMLYAFAQHPLRQLRRFVKTLTEEAKQKIIQTYVGERKSRRSRPGRALEFGYPLTFDLMLDFGSYRDIQRHRICTQERQRLTPYLGFYIPLETIEAGFENDIKKCRDLSTQLYGKLKNDFPEEAQYAVLFGFNIRFCMAMNDREAMHMLELRSGPQGHPTYRKLSQIMHDKIRERSGWRSSMMKFVDHNDYYWARAESEAKQRVKEKELEGKYGKK